MTTNKPEDAMTDRELIQLAARACGMTTSEALGKIGRPTNMYSEWNPINYDGDALRLAVKLGIDICINLEEMEVWADDCRESVIGNAEVATRRAIVRAAAEIGRTMQ